MGSQSYVPLDRLAEPESRADAAYRTSKDRWSKLGDIGKMLLFGDPNATARVPIDELGRPLSIHDPQYKEWLTGQALEMSGAALTGGMPFATRGALGMAGGRAPVERQAKRLERLFEDANVPIVSRDKSRVSPSEYFYIEKPGTDETLKIRISNHPDKYGADFSVDPTAANFSELQAYLREHGVNIADRVNAGATRFANQKKALADRWSYGSWSGLDKESQSLAQQISSATNAQELKAAEQAFGDLAAQAQQRHIAATGRELTGKTYIDSSYYNFATGRIDADRLRQNFERHSPEYRAAAEEFIKERGR